MADREGVFPDYKGEVSLDNKGEQLLLRACYIMRSMKDELAYVQRHAVGVYTFNEEIDHFTSSVREYLNLDTIDGD